MIKCGNCGKEFDDTKQVEVAMGAVECPECKAVLDQEGKVLQKKMDTFFSRLVNNRRPYVDNRENHTCECVDCGYTKKTSKHCKDIKCPDCGGEMRRKERPGSGKK
jgi:hypothetical protein